MYLDIIEMPLNLGANKLGVEQAFQSLDDNFHIPQLMHSHQCTLIRNIQCSSFDQVQSKDEKMRNIQEIISCNTQLADVVANSFKQHHFPLVIGGDHALSWGSISGISSVNDQVGCIYIDAHGDFNSADTSASHNVHGMHMSYLMGLVDSPYIDFYVPKRKLDPRNVFFIATRSLDPGEKQFAEQYHLNIQTSDDIRRFGVERIVSQILSQMKNSGLTKFHLSFDVDSIDPSEAPGTGVPERDGITVIEAQYIIERLFKTQKIISMDFVEYNPLLDIDNRTLGVCRDLLQTINDSLNN